VLDKLDLINDRDLSTALKPSDFMDIVKENRYHLEKYYDGAESKLDDEFSWYNVIGTYEAMAGKGSLDNIFLLEFDDFDDTHRLAYGIGVNTQLKRITVMIRGTYAETTDDWKRNLQFDTLQVPLPAELDSPQRSMKVHRGCYEYLFRNTLRGPTHPEERYEEVLNTILWVCEKYPDFKLFISGHSLGGALALLLAFHSSADRRMPKPVTCISVGSLAVGDESFQSAFGEAERRGWVRHLRVTNEDDPVPKLPPFPWYKPVGMNLKLCRKSGYALSHSSSLDSAVSGNSFTELWHATYDNTGSIEDILKPHLLPEYLRRLERVKDELVSKSMNDLYMNVVQRNHEVKD